MSGWRPGGLVLAIAASVAGLTERLEALPALPTASKFSVVGDAAVTPERVRAILSRYGIALSPTIDAPDADDAAYYLAETLRRTGFPEATVAYRFAGEEVVFEVASGPRMMLGQLEFEGIGAIPHDRARAIFENSMRQATLTPFGPIPFARAGADQASDRLRTALEDEGFAGADIEVFEEPRNERMNLRVVVNEGPLHTIRNIDLRPPGLPEKIVTRAGQARGEVYYPGWGAVFRLQILQDLENAGYYDARVESSTEIADDGAVTVRINADPGRLYRLGGVRVEGTKRSHVAAVLGRLGLKPGMLYDESAVNQAARRLWFTGAFSNVETLPSPNDDGTVDLLLRLEEGRARDISVTAGYGQWERGFVSVTFTDRNFLGTLNRAFVTGLASFRSLGAVAGLSDPWFFRTATEVTLSGYGIRRETPAYRSTFFGAGLTVERKRESSNLTGWRAGYAWRTSLDTTLFGDDAGDGADIDYSLGELTFGQTWDRRNDPLVPKSGFLLSWDAGLASRALLGDISYGRLTGQATAYFPLRPIDPDRPFVPFFVLNHRVGAILPFGDTEEVPVQERFFLGGPETVRSFQLDGMAPRARNGTPVGGQFFLLANAEFQMPLLGQLYGVAFLDAGNLAPSVGTFDFDETRVAAGLGARLYTPLGAVRFDYGYNLIRRDGDPIGAWQFGFGFTF